MYILMIGPKLIVTDKMIYKGTEWLLKQAGHRVDEYIEINDHAIEEIKPSNQPTHIIVLGTPWLWDQCHRSNKYQNVRHLVSKYPQAKRLFFGIGTCYPLGKEELIENELVKDKVYLAEFFKESTIVTRDTLAQNLLQDYNASLLPCPAYFALNDEPARAKTEDVLIWYDPTIGISSVDYYPGSDHLYKYLGSIIKESNRKVYCVDEKELELARKLGIYPEVIKNIDHAVEILMTAKTIVSGRVHLAVPAVPLLGPSIKLIAVDSRHRVLSDLDYINKNNKLDASAHIALLTKFLS